ncbi:uncharacterized protein LOC111715131, partial [Eurytemora carolleeae]|uniref:uncharacterized protein LOC111715131 n=1 Tax=Eurytemora carolleeae TaxID=1294199 RepID=UPI000C7890EA
MFFYTISLLQAALFLARKYGVDGTDIFMFRKYGVDGTDITWAVVGSASHLPCNITPPHIEDSVYLVLWYKDDNPQPVYSYDARGSTSKHWSENHQFGSRAIFRTNITPAQLVLTSVLKSDSGVYKCRVDF